jgi:hypothetical protein
MAGSHQVNFEVVPIRTGFDGGTTGAIAPGFHETEIESTDFIENFSLLKSRHVCSQL